MVGVRLNMCEYHIEGSVGVRILFAPTDLLIIWLMIMNGLDMLVGFSAIILSEFLFLFLLLTF